MLLNNLVFTYTIPDFQKVKPELLARIERLGTHSAIEANQQISNTDWYIQNSARRDYLEPIAHVLDEAFQKLKSDVFGSVCNSPAVMNYWFQQYGANDFHGWHAHPEAAYVANIFFELPPGVETQFMVLSDIKTIPVEEGQILFFPAFLPHQSPPNSSGSRKTSVAINITLV